MPRDYDNMIKNEKRCAKADQARKDTDLNKSLILKGDQKAGEIDFADLIIINHKSIGYKMWMFVIIVLEVATSYIYAFMSAYRVFDWRNFWIPIESIFFVDMLLHFMVDFMSTQKSGVVRVRKFSEIVKRYMDTDFIWDIIPLIPL